MKSGVSIEQAMQRTVNYLYKIDGDVTPEQAVAIGQLRQMINEEFVRNKKSVSSQLIYDMLKEVL